MGFIDRKQDCFFSHGFTIGLATFPLALFGAISWSACIVYSISLAIMMGAWCKFFSNDWVEELGRGAFILLAFWIVNFIL